jgi:putative transcriptional regulator
MAEKNIDDFSSIFTKQLKPAQGLLLLAEPFMDSPEFRRSVILLTEHGQKGSMGFIVNRKLNITPAQAIDDFPKFEDMLYYGGPVSSDQLFYLHTLGSLLEGSIEILPGVYMGGDFEALKDMLHNKQVGPTQIKFFAGYSGWTANQLNKELKENSWIVAKGKAEHLFNNKDQEKLWKQVLHNLGGKYAMIAEFPEDPTLN